MRVKPSRLLVLGCLLISGSLLAAEITWNVSLWGKRRGFTEHLEYLSQAVNERTNGEFVIKLHYGEALSKSRENLDGIAIGAFEMAQFCASYHTDKNPSLSVLELPMLPITNLKTQIAVDKAVYEHPAVIKDLARWNSSLFMSSPLPQYNLMGKGEPPYNISDLNGKRIRAPGGVGKALKTVGAVPTSLPAGEVYTALSTNAIQMAAFAPHALLSFNIVEQSDWYTTNLNPGTVHCPVVINSDALAALPQKYARVLYDTREDAYQHYLDTYQKIYDKFYPAIKQAGIQTITYGDEELRAFRSQAGVPIWQQWIKENAAKGLPAQQLLDLVLKTAKANP